MIRVSPVFPLLPLAVYAGVRATGDRDTHCWIVPIEGLEWVINLPPLLAILVGSLCLARAQPRACDPVAYFMIGMMHCVVWSFCASRLSSEITIFSPQINIIFVVNIIRILVSIVRAPNNNEPLQYR